MTDNEIPGPISSVVVEERLSRLVESGRDMGYSPAAGRKMELAARIAFTGREACKSRSAISESGRVRIIPSRW